MRGDYLMHDLMNRRILSRTTPQHLLSQDILFFVSEGTAYKFAWTRELPRTTLSRKILFMLKMASLSQIQMLPECIETPPYLKGRFYPIAARRRLFSISRNCDHDGSDVQSPERSSCTSTAPRASTSTTMSLDTWAGILEASNKLARPRTTPLLIVGAANAWFASYCAAH